MPTDVNAPRTDGRAVRWAGHRQQRRSGFVAAGLALVEATGPAVSVSAIAAATGVGRAVIYRHFTDKADLEQAMAAEAAASLLAAITPSLRVDGPLGEAVSEALFAYLRWLAGHPQLFRLLRLQAESAPVSSPLNTAKSTVAQRLSLLARHSMPGLPSGRAADLLAAGIVGMADQAINAWVDDPGGMTEADLVAFLTPVVQGAVVGSRAARPVPLINSVAKR